MNRSAWRRLCLTVGTTAWLATWVPVAMANAEEKVLKIHPSQFSPANHGVRFYRRMAGLGDLCVAEGAGYFTAVLDLPVGAELVSIRGDFVDEAEGAFGVLSLYRIGETTTDLLAVTPMSLPKPRSGVVAAVVDGSENVRHAFQYVLHLTLTGPGVCLRAAEVLWR